MQTAQTKLIIEYYDSTSVRGVFNKPDVMRCLYDPALVAEYGADTLWQRWKSDPLNSKRKVRHVWVEMWSRNQSDKVWCLRSARTLFQEKTSA